VCEPSLLLERLVSPSCLLRLSSLPLPLDPSVAVEAAVVLQVMMGQSLEISHQSCCQSTCESTF
jgi:hypothetical protein